jgi:hypothetical protein
MTSIERQTNQKKIFSLSPVLARLVTTIPDENWYTGVFKREVDRVINATSVRDSDILGKISKICDRYKHVFADYGESENSLNFTKVLYVVGMQLGQESKNVEGAAKLIFERFEGTLVGQKELVRRELEMKFPLAEKTIIDDIRSIIFLGAQTRLPAIVSR